MNAENGKQISYGETTPKLLSVVVTGRNDDYMGNFKYRITTCLNYLARGLKDLGHLGDVEILVTDWNSEVPLAKVLPLSPEARRISHFVYVPPNVARTLQNPGEVFYPTCAMNTSLRRAEGEFLMMFDADSLIPCHSLRALLELLEGELTIPLRLKDTFFFCSRHLLPWEIVQRGLSLEDWDRYFLLNAGQLPSDPGLSGLGIAGAAQMMHRDIWHACRGYNEQLRIQGWLDAELTLRVTQRYPWIDLSSLGISLFHMEHWPRNRRIPGVQAHNPHSVSPTFEVNDEYWGLGDYALDIQRAEAIVESAKASKASVVDGKGEACNKTRAQIGMELIGPLVRRHVQMVIPGRSFDLAEWEILCILSWYSLCYFPRSYMEFGISTGRAAAVVGAACPGVEIYGIDPFFPGSSGKETFAPDYVARILQNLGYRGYMRFVAGNPRTALGRLRMFSEGPVSFDLVLVRCEMFESDAVQQLRDLILHLTPGGMIVLQDASVDSFGRVWGELRAGSAYLSYLQCKSQRTGLILKSALLDDEVSATSDTAEEFRMDIGKPPGASLACQFRCACHALTNPRKYLEYTKRMYSRFLWKRQA